MFVICFFKVRSKSCYSIVVVDNRTIFYCNKTKTKSASLSDQQISKKNYSVYIT